VPRFVVCIPAPDGQPSVPPCGDVDGVAYVAVVQEFAAPGEVHFANSNELFAYAFIAVMTFYVVGVVFGAFFKLIREW
jgi:hypothetical protein